MPEIGIRELKASASEIVRAVREERAEYVITHRCKPVAMIVPFEEAVGRAGEASFEAFWAEMNVLIEEMESSTPSDAKSPLRQLFEDRDSS